MVNIYKIYITGDKSNYVWLFNKFGESLVVGAKPEETIKSIVESYRIYDKTTLHKKFTGTALKFLACQIFEGDDYGCFKCLKNRGGNFNVMPPFKTIDEMLIFCDLNDWPKPECLDDLIDKMVL